MRMYEGEALQRSALRIVEASKKRTKCNTNHLMCLYLKLVIFSSVAHCQYAFSYKFYTKNQITKPLHTAFSFVRPDQRQRPFKPALRYTGAVSKGMERGVVA